MGQKIAAYDATGNVYAFYDSIDAPVPASVTADTINVTDAQWMAILTTPGYLVVGGALVEPPPPSADVLLANAQAVQIAANSAACQSAIEAGFISSALGASHTYPSTPIDQQNLAASVLATLMPGIAANWVTPLMCATGNVWSYVEHTAVQVQKVGTDGKAVITGFLIHNETLRQQILAATQVADVEALTW
jgi:hypothetical protein